ncbi:MAG TPA: RagB/SusD family nutrient uptake outer membrane protein [Pricia antarctica]|uniref:RagB/SusD family nutrient uptake outer membrane protein n=1 Tax=Pricia antarctica TaxID=641691 RepID=A0A831VQW1_9FLAO|nr:RagB/SusD family nutrient uptake outer membrane protein [Pricia antarctica]
MKCFINLKSRIYSLLRNKYFLFLLLPIMASCSNDLLIEEPKTVAAELFYNTADEVEAAVNASYAPIRSSIYAEQIVILDAHTDWGYGRGSRSDYNNFQGFNSGNINNAGSRWNAFYQSIRNANFVIANAPLGTSITSSEIDLFVAEAKFIRAFNYFNLVRNWGGVPLRTDLNLDEVDVKRSTEAEVYDFIFQDLSDAENKLPEEPRNIGRPTTYAVKSLMADVYLTKGMYSEASSKAFEVIQSDKFSLVPVTSVEDFQYNLFGPDILTTTEEIFYLKFARQPNLGNWILFILNHPDTGLFNFGGAYAHYSDSTNPFYVNWDDNDLRKGLWDQIDFGLGETTLVSKKYVDQNAVERSAGAGNDLPIYRYAEILLIYAEAMARETGVPTAEGMEALNKVHRRAYGQEIDSPSSFDYNLEDYNLDSFVDLVLDERAYEFVFEGKRWYDLKRTGKAAQTIIEAKGITIAERHYLWPIPIQEIDFNDAINSENQNPGY